MPLACSPHPSIMPASFLHVLPGLVGAWGEIWHGGALGSVSSSPRWGAPLAASLAVRPASLSVNQALFTDGLIVETTNLSTTYRERRPWPRLAVSVKLPVEQSTLKACNWRVSKGRILFIEDWEKERCDPISIS